MLKLSLLKSFLLIFLLQSMAICGFSQGTSDYVSFREKKSDRGGNGFLSSSYQVKVLDFCVSEYSREKFDLAVELAPSFKGLRYTKKQIQVAGQSYDVKDDRIIIHGLTSGQKYTFQVTNNATQQNTTISGYANLYCRLGKAVNLKSKPPQKQVPDVLYYLLASTGQLTNDILPASRGFLDKRVTQAPKSSAFYNSSVNVKMGFDIPRAKKIASVPQEVVSLVMSAVVTRTVVDVSDDDAVIWTQSTTSDGAEVYSYSMYTTDNLGFVIGQVTVRSNSSLVYTTITHPSGNVRIRAFHDFESQISEVTDTYPDGSTITDVYDFGRIQVIGADLVVTENPDSTGYSDLYTASTVYTFNYDINDPDDLDQLRISSSSTAATNNSAGASLGVIDYVPTSTLGIIERPYTRLSDLPPLGVTSSTSDYVTTSETVSLGGNQQQTILGRITNFLSTNFAPNNDGPVEHSTDNSAGAAPKPPTLTVTALSSSSLKIVFSGTNPRTDDENYINWGSNASPVSLFQNGQFIHRYIAPWGDSQKSHMWIVDGFRFGNNGWQQSNRVFNNGYVVLNGLNPGATYRFKAFRGAGNGPSDGGPGRISSRMGPEVSVTMPGLLEQLPTQVVDKDPDDNNFDFGSNDSVKAGDRFRYDHLNVYYNGERVCLMKETSPNAVDNDYSELSGGFLKKQLSQLFSKLWRFSVDQRSCASIGGEVLAVKNPFETVPVSAPSLVQAGDNFRFDNLNMNYNGTRLCLMADSNPAAVPNNYSDLKTGPIKEQLDALYHELWTLYGSQTKCR